MRAAADTEGMQTSDHLQPDSVYASSADLKRPDHNASFAVVTNISKLLSIRRWHEANNI
jgi:hypothetical protein